MSVLEEEVTTDNDISEIPPVLNNCSSSSSSTASAFYNRKRESKPIRVLTVFAYVLSVSLAAIFLSIYYVFVWDGQATMDITKIYQQTQQISPQTFENYESSNKQLKSENLRGIPLISNEEGFIWRSYNRSMVESSSNGTEAGDTTTTSSSNFQVGLPEPTVDYDDATPFTTDVIEENSTWMPDLEDFNSDFSFDKRSIFIKRLFGDDNDE